MKYGWMKPSPAVMRSMGLSRNARDTKERSEICICNVDDNSDVSDVDNDVLMILVIMIR